MGRKKLNISEEERLIRLTEQRRRANAKANLKKKQLKLRCVENLTIEEIEKERKRKRDAYAISKRMLVLRPPLKKVECEPAGCGAGGTPPILSNSSTEYDALTNKISDVNSFNKCNPIIKCGEVQIIKNVWNLQYVCAQCGEILQELQKFLMHSLHHDLNATEDEFNSIIKHMTGEKHSIDETPIMPKVFPDSSIIKQECIVEEYQISEVNSGEYCTTKTTEPASKTLGKNIQHQYNPLVNTIQITDGSTPKSNSIGETFVISALQPVKHEFIAEDYQLHDVNTTFVHPGYCISNKSGTETSTEDGNNISMVQQKFNATVNKVQSLGKGAAIPHLTCNIPDVLRVKQESSDMDFQENSVYNEHHSFGHSTAKDQEPMEGKQKKISSFSNDEEEHSFDMLNTELQNIKQEFEAEE